MILEVLQEQLKRRFGQRFIYEIAESVNEAWAVIEDLSDLGVNILVIVSNWLMPGIKGDEFLIEVHQRFPAIRTTHNIGMSVRNTGA
jgi:CheY-like chemotaxis protein